MIVAGFALRWSLAQANLTPDGVSFRAFQKLIYYPTWTRLDPLVLGVSCAALERFRLHVWRRITKFASWIWLPGIALVALALYLGEDQLTVNACVWQFPLIALGMSALLIAAVGPTMPLAHVRIPGAAFLASIAYSVYLSHKLVIHGAIALCEKLNLAQTSVPALLLVQLMIYTGGVILFLAVERPFLLLRRRVARRSPAR